MQLIEKLKWGKYVSPLSNRHAAPFHWYGFKHRFGSELVSKVFHEFGLKTGDGVAGSNLFGPEIEPERISPS
jgi:hypothetical protein